MSTQADEMIVLLKSIDASLKTLVSRKGSARGDGAKRFADGGDSNGPKPCIGCAMALKCHTACSRFDQWVFNTGLTKAKPGAAEFKHRNAA